GPKRRDEPIRDSILEVLHCRNDIQCSPQHTVMKSNTPIPENPTVTSVALIAWSVLLCVAFYVCYFSHLDVLGFIGPHEPRYAWIARAMVETHDWVTPRLYGRPWFEKPPLYYWGAGLCFKWFGVS